MLNREVCEKSLEELKFALDNFKHLNKESLWDCISLGAVGFEKLIKEHFELVEKYNRLYDGCTAKCEILKKLLDEVEKWEYEYYLMCNLLENIKPYKFEDLKVGMWVWDDKYKSCLKVIGFYGFDIHVKSGVGVYKYDYYITFEENRFFPLSKANEVIKNGKENL